MQGTNPTNGTSTAPPCLSHPWKCYGITHSLTHSLTQALLCRAAWHGCTAGCASPTLPMRHTQRIRQTAPWILAPPHTVQLECYRNICVRTPGCSVMEQSAGRQQSQHLLPRRGSCISICQPCQQPNTHTPCKTHNMAVSKTSCKTKPTAWATCHDSINS
jgi:hypothetical protein